ncbi:unnamed protein product [Urochloa humidicola]
MTQKQTLFKGQSKKKTVPPNRHGKAPHVRKGTRAGIDLCVVHRLDLVPLCLLFSVDFVGCPRTTCGGTEGKRVVKPTKFTKDMDADKELTKFINQCNEIKAVNLASKEGGDLNIVKADADQSKSKKSEAKMRICGNACMLFS